MLMVLMVDVEGPCSCQHHTSKCLQTWWCLQTGQHFLVPCLSRHRVIRQEKQHTTEMNYHAHGQVGTKRERQGLLPFAPAQTCTLAPARYRQRKTKASLTSGLNMESAARTSSALPTHHSLCSTYSRLSQARTQASTPQAELH